MPKFKGTQGKWKVTESKFGQVGYVASKNGHTIASVYAETNVPYTSYSNKDNEELLANTKLIAAAPEMLQALDRINNLIYANVISAGSEEYFEIRDLCCDLIKKATE